MVPVGQAGARHVFAQAALLKEVSFQAQALTVEQVIDLVDKADGNVGDDFGWAGVHEFPVKLEALGLPAAELTNVESFF